MTDMRWRKSRRSHQNGACVELSGTLTAIRDSKNGTGSMLRGDVAALVAAIKYDQFAR